MSPAASGGAVDARIGTVVAGRYQIVGVLGTGGMGAVYAALHTYTGRRVAVKLLRMETGAPPETTARFLREARAPASVGHPDIVEVFDAGVADDGALYIVLELLEGETLADVARAHRCEVRPLVRVGIKLLDALAAAHAGGLVHRDVKPANIFVLANGPDAPRIKLLDFGIARHAESDDEVTASGAVVGSREYMSPEQALGASIDARTDVWGVGATLFRCLTGRGPLPRLPGKGFLAAFIAQEVPSIATLRDGLPDALVDAIDRALKKNPEDRWPSAQAMAARLRDAELVLASEGAPPAFAPPEGVAVEDLVMAVEPVTGPTRANEASEPRAHGGSRRARRAALASVIVLLVGGATWGFVHRMHATAVPAPPAAIARIASPPQPSAREIAPAAVAPSAAPTPPTTALATAQPAHPTRRPPRAHADPAPARRRPTDMFRGYE